MPKALDRIYALLNHPQVRQSMVESPPKSRQRSFLPFPVVTQDMLDETIMDALEKKRPLGWVDAGTSLLCVIHDDICRKVGVSSDTFRNMTLLDRIDARLKELAKEGWVFWNKKAQRWEINEGPDPEARAAYSFHMSTSQVRKFEWWAEAHVKKCGKFPEVSGARWTFSFTPSGLVTGVRATCLKCKKSEDFTEWDLT